MPNDSKSVRRNTPTAVLPIQDLKRETLTARILEAGWPAYRARQIWHWMYRQCETRFEAMSNLPEALRAELAAAYTAEPYLLLESLRASDGVAKLLLRATDGETVETVCIPAEARRTVCVSTQAGCALDCAFCASAKDGFARNLSAGEIVAQVVAAARDARARPTHVVFMGMGEPLLNLDALLDSLAILNDPQGFGIAARRMTISTCGVVPGIRRLAACGMQFELSVSLHAPDNALRNPLMPVNRRWPLETLLGACLDYVKATGRIITFEYTLVAGLNDRLEQAGQLARLLRGLPCRVNLIPLSPIPEYDGLPPTEADMQRFRTVIRRAGINVTIRQSRGGAVNAACGQLRRQSTAAQGQNRRTGFLATSARRIDGDPADQTASIDQ